MESRLERIDRVLTSFLGTVGGETQEYDLHDLIRGRRLKASKINDPQKVEEIFQCEPVLGQTTLPFDGIGDMEICRVRTPNDIARDRANKPSVREIAEEKQRLKEFVGA